MYNGELLESFGRVCETRRRLVKNSEGLVVARFFFFLKNVNLCGGCGRGRL